MSPESTTTTTNIDADEIAQFSRQAKSWWDPDGPFRPLHQIGPTRLQYIRDVAVQHFAIADAGLRPLRGLRCLDVGCGGGLISEPLARMGGAVTGIDPAAENIDTAIQHARVSDLTIDYRAVTAEELVRSSEAYDLVVCLEVIEHVPEPADFVATLARLLTPNGLLVMSTINRTPQSYAFAIIGAEYILRWLPVGTHQWDKFVRPAELKRFMAAAGLANFAARGLVYNPLKDQWSLSDDTGVNYLATGAHEALP